MDQTREGSESIKVSVAHKWTKQRDGVDIKKEALKPYDWTFSTFYSGTCDQDVVLPTNERIDIAKLSVPEPILFYDEVLLYEDELGDNGTGIISVKVRVMSSCFLVLQRFFLRVDGVLIRFIDTRVFHEFGSNGIIREFHVKEIGYNDIVPKLPISANGPDFSYMLNMNWISTLIEDTAVKSSRFEKIHLCT